ncbi:MAG: DNA polymerase III subunit delta [Enterobacteriaceae bacterium PSpicST2]|nr:MAG: DNA polymerase III subunit delta [Enterobacteriaceae bacterium PSpicST2]
MFFLNIKKIIKEFNKDKLKIFLFNGNDIFLINENKKIIKKIFNNNDYININIKNNNINWNKIILLCKKSNLFMDKKILFLEFDNNNINYKIFKYIFKIFKKFYQKIIIVLIGLYITKLLKNFLINNNIYNSIININCSKKIFNNWLNSCIIKMKFNFDLNFINLIFNYFYKNFIELSQFLDLLLLIYPNNNFNITNIKKIIYNTYYFTFSNFIENLLIGNINNSLNILKKIRKKKIKPILLLSILQNELIIIIKIKFYNNNKILYKNLNIKQKINFKFILYNKIVKRLSYYDFNNIFLILVKIDNLIKINNKINILIWNEIKNLLILICK